MKRTYDYCDKNRNKVDNCDCYDCRYGYVDSKSFLHCNYISKKIEEKNITVTGEKIYYHTAKHDKEKARMDLVPLNQIQKIADVLTFGATKYGENTWQKVPEAKKRYLAALLRHLTAYQKGDMIDTESGLSHLSHVLTNAMFLCYFEENEEVKN